MGWSEEDKASQTGSSSSQRPHLWLRDILPRYIQVFCSFSWQQNRPGSVELSAGHRGRSQPEVPLGEHNSIFGPFLSCYSWVFRAVGYSVSLFLHACTYSLQKRNILYDDGCFWKHCFFAYFKNGSSLIAEHGTINPWECSLKMHLPVPFPASLKAVRGLWPERLLNRKILLRTEQFVLPRGRQNTPSSEGKFLDDKSRQLQLMGCSWRKW